MSRAQKADIDQVVQVDAHRYSRFAMSFMRTSPERHDRTARFQGFALGDAREGAAYPGWILPYPPRSR